MHQADVLLLTAGVDETRSIFQTLQEWSGRAPVHHFIGGKTCYDLGLLGGARIWLVQSEPGSMTPGGMQATARVAIDTLKPRSAILVGVALGLDPARQQIGDVLVAAQVAVCRAGGDRTSVSPRLLDRFRDTGLFWNDGSGIHYGLLLSGDALFARLDEERLREPDAIGADVEGAGLYAAALDRKVDWIVVKGIAGCGPDAPDDPPFLQVAARSAARFVIHTIQQGALR